MASTRRPRSALKSATVPVCAKSHWRCRNGCVFSVRSVPTEASRTWPSRMVLRTSASAAASGSVVRSSTGRRRSSTSPPW